MRHEHARMITDEIRGLGKVYEVNRGGHARNYNGGDEAAAGQRLALPTQYPSLHDDSSDDSSECAEETDRLLPSKRLHARALRIEVPAHQRPEELHSPIKPFQSPVRVALTPAEQVDCLPPQGQTSCWDTVLSALRVLLVLSVIAGLVTVVVLTHDESEAWPFTPEQGVDILHNLPAGFAFYLFSDVLAFCITRGWFCSSAEFDDPNAEEEEEEEWQSVPLLISDDAKGEALEGEEEEASECAPYEPQDLFHTLVQALQAGCLGAFSVGVLDTLWLNRLNLLLPPPEDGRLDLRAARDLAVKSILDSIVYGGLANSFGIVARRCLFKAESFADSMQVWRLCILQVVCVISHLNPPPSLHVLLRLPVPNAYPFLAATSNVCIHTREREGARERERERGSERARERERESARARVCVCW